MTAFVNENGEYLDYSGPDIGLTKQAANFYEFKIKGNVSSTFKVSNNSINRRALGYYSQAQFPPPQVFTQELDGNKISRGTISITSVDEKDISLFFVSGNANWFQDMAFNLREILFPSEMSVLVTDVDGRKAATSGIIFPIVDYWAYGQKGAQALKVPQSFNTDEPPEIIEVHPWLYLHTLVEYMGVHAAIRISGDLIEDSLFRKIVISTPGPEYFVPESQIQSSYALLQAGPFGTAAEGLYDNALDPQPVRLNTVVEGANYLNAYSFSPAITGTYRIEWTMRVNSTGTYQFYLYKNGALDSVIFNGTITSGTDLKGVQWLNLISGQPYQIWVDGVSAPYRLDYVSGVRYITNFSIKLEPIGGITPLNSIGTGVDAGYVLPGMCVPDMKAVDFIKFLANFFSCVVTFDEYSRTIGINKLSSFVKEQAEDWSEYYVSHNVKPSVAAKNNYIQNEPTEEDNIRAYNESHNFSYGGGTIISSSPLKEEQELFKIPFGGTWDWRNRSNENMFFPYCKFYSIEEVQRTTYSAVTNSGGFSQFTSTWDDPTRNTDLFFVISNSGEYNGYFMAYTSGTVSNPILLAPFGANDAGTIVKMKATRVRGPHRMMICNPGRNLTEFGGSSVSVHDNSAVVISTQTTGPMCWFDKPDLSIKDELPIDSVNESLAVDSEKPKPITISERFYGPLKNFLDNPIIEAEFLLPASVFQSFDFTTYIYIKTKDLTGYFFIQKIENYKGTLIPVRAELLLAD